AERSTQHASQPARALPNPAPAPAAAPVGGASIKAADGSTVAILNALPGITWFAVVAIDAPASPSAAPVTPIAAPASPAPVVRKPGASDQPSTNSTPPLTISQFRV